MPSPAVQRLQHHVGHAELCGAAFGISPSGMSSPKGLAGGFLSARGESQHPIAFPGGWSHLGAGRGGCDREGGGAAAGGRVW